MEEVGSGWTRQRALEVVNDVQNEELGVDLDIMRVKPDPFVETVDGEYSQAASTSLYDSSDGTQGALVGDIRTVRKIYRLPASSTLDNLTPIDPANDKPQYVDFDPTPQRIVARVDVVDSKKADNEDCILKWWEQYNPGDTTITWRAWAYTWPDQLTAETVDLTMPEDFQRTLLLWGCLRHMERREFGRFDPVEHALERKRFRSKYGSRTGQDIKGVAQPRYC